MSDPQPPAPLPAEEPVFDALARIAGVICGRPVALPELLEHAPMPPGLPQRDQAVLLDLSELARWMQRENEERRAQSDFLDNVSHEIRTPLNGVLGLTRLLLDEPLTPQQRKYAELVDASAASLLTLINDLLDLRKIESGRMELEDQPFRLDQLLQELGDLYRLRAREKGLQFLLEAPPTLPKLVTGDIVGVRQVLNNLLSNALKFTQQGEFGLLVARADAARGAGLLRFTVYDTGIGIPFAVQQRLFERFTQADRAIAREYGGTGLGLAIVKKLCEQMGGMVMVQSEPGRGSSFRCELPLPEARGPAPTAAPAPLDRPRVAWPTRILVAEDNPTNQVVIKGLLAQAGYAHVTVVDDGQQAVQAAAGAEFDLVLMDCRMPVMDGYEATRALRAAGIEWPIIALTANVVAGERERCLGHGMDDYLAKPVEPARLVQVLAQWSGNAVDAAAAAPPSDVSDRARALDRLGGDEELLAMGLASFREHAPRTLQAARAALAAGQAADLHRHLHSLAGSSSMLGADALAQQARGLEALARDGKADEVRDGFASLEAEFARFIDASRAW